MKRSMIREKLFQFMYVIQIQLDDLEIQRRYCIESMVDEGFKAKDFKYFNEVLDYYLANSRVIDELIAEHLRGGWSLNRLSKVDLALLRLAVSELQLYKDTPAGVVASEIVILAKNYSEESSKIYINGILGNIIKSMEKTL